MTELETRVPTIEQTLSKAKKDLQDAKNTESQATEQVGINTLHRRILNYKILRPNPILLTFHFTLILSHSTMLLR